MADAVVQAAAAYARCTKTCAGTYAAHHTWWSAWGAKPIMPLNVSTGVRAACHDGSATAAGACFLFLLLLCCLSSMIEVFLCALARVARLVAVLLIALRAETDAGCELICVRNGLQVGRGQLSAVSGCLAFLLFVQGIL